MSETTQADLVLENIGELVTCSAAHGEDSLGIVRSGAVVVRDKRIIWVGPSCEVDALPEVGPATSRYDLDGRVVLPGLVDCHTHLVFGGSREEEFAQRVAGASYQDIAAAGGGILSTVRATRDASFDQLFTLGLERLSQMGRFGVTTCEIKSGYGLSVRDEIKVLEVIRGLRQAQPISIVSTFLGAHSVPPEYSSDRAGYLDLLVEELIPRVASESLAEYCDVFCEEGVFSVEESRRVLTAAKQAGMRVKVHAEQLTSFGGAKLAAELGATSADHLEHADDAAIEAMREAGTTAVLLPGATFFLDQPFPDMRRLLEAGVHVAISTDFNPGSSPVVNLPLVGTMAAIRMKVTIADVIRGMTVEAARALDRADDVGAIVPGLAADFAVFDIRDHRTLLYRFGANHCSMVFKGGKLLVGGEGEG